MKLLREEIIQRSYWLEIERQNYPIGLRLRDITSLSWDYLMSIWFARHAKKDIYRRWEYHGRAHHLTAPKKTCMGIPNLQKNTSRFATPKICVWVLIFISLVIYFAIYTFAHESRWICEVAHLTSLLGECKKENFLTIFFSLERERESYIVIIGIGHSTDQSSHKRVPINRIHCLQQINMICFCECVIYHWL